LLAVRAFGGDVDVEGDHATGFFKAADQVPNGAGIVESGLLVPARRFDRVQRAFFLAFLRNLG